MQLKPIYSKQVRDLLTTLDDMIDNRCEELINNCVNDIHEDKLISSIQEEIKRIKSIAIPLGYELV